MKAYKFQRSTASIMIFILFCLVTAPSYSAYDIFLDADSPATGSLLGSQALVTGFGTITFIGEIRDRATDLEFNTAGALGDVFDIGDSDHFAQLKFDFDVTSLTFIYGGNAGEFSVEARDQLGNVIDSFYQEDTYHGQPAGPITLSGQGIRSLYWQDLQGSFAPIDNVGIWVPEPATLLLLTLGGLVLRKRK